MVWGGEKFFAPTNVQMCRVVRERVPREKRTRLFESSRIFRYIGGMEKNDSLKMIGLSTVCRVGIAAGTDTYV